jgi:hypothetical protein
MNLSNKNTSIILFIILTLSFILNITTFKNGHNWGGDFSVYINQARSMVEGTVNDLVNIEKYLVENSTNNVGTILGSWGFAFLLSPVYYFFGLNIFAMKVLVSLFFVLSLCTVFLCFKDRLSNLQNLLLVSIIAFNTWFFDFKDNVLTDIPFLFFSLFTLFLINKFIIKKDIWINKLLSYSILGLFLFLSYYVRSAGLVLLPTLLIVQYVEGNFSSKKNVAILLDKFNYVPYIIFLILAFIISRILPGGGDATYLDILLNKNFGKILSDILYLTVLPSRSFPFLFINMNAYGLSYNKFSLVLYSIILLLVIFGMIKNAKKDYMYIFYAFFTFLVLLTFSQRQGFRLIIPIFPFFLYFLIIGLSKVNLSFTISDKYNSFKINADSVFSCALILISLFYISHASYQNITFNKTNVIEGPYTPDSIGLFNFIKTNTKENDAIIFNKPRVVSLYTNRKSAYIRQADDILNSNANYIAFNKKNIAFSIKARYLRENLDCVFENETFLLCSLNKTS